MGNRALRLAAIFGYSLEIISVNPIYGLYYVKELITAITHK